MRRRLALLVAATTSIVVVAFLVPLALLVRDVGADRALDSAESAARSLTPVIATAADPATVTLALERADAARRLTVFLPDGRVLGVPATADAAVALARQGRAFSTDADGGRQVLVPVQRGDGTVVVRAFVPTSELRRGVVPAVAALAALGAGLLLVALLVADRLARTMVQPVAALADTAHRLSAGDLDARVEPAGPPEVAEVGAALNRLARRITELLTAERENVADLSHRLRTPVTALRLDSEGLRDPAEAARLTADVDRLERTVDALIREARRPVREGVGVTSDLAAVTRERVKFWGALAEDQGRRYGLEVPPGPLPVAVAREDLAAAVDALLGNVVAHTPDGTGFRVTVSAGVDAARLVVEDDGPGLPGAAVLARGASGAGGTGLGLDIVRRTAEAAGGTVTATNVPGARITVTLPNA